MSWALSGKQGNREKYQECSWCEGPCPHEGMLCKILHGKLLLTVDGVHPLKGVKVP